MDINYFVEYLTGYLNKEEFYLGADYPSTSYIRNDAEDALEVFAQHRKAGLDLNAAIELSVAELTSNLGVSKITVLQNSLKSILGTDVLKSEEMEFIYSAVIFNPELLEGVKSRRYGLDPDSVEENSEIIAHRMAKLYTRSFSKTQSI